VTRFERALLDDIRANGADILSTIRSEKDLSDETEAKLRAHIETFSKSFS
jgi:F-type H+-transporting ATPase subunit alpha